MVGHFADVLGSNSSTIGEGIVIEVVVTSWKWDGLFLSPVDVVTGCSDHLVDNDVQLLDLRSNDNLFNKVGNSIVTGDPSNSSLSVFVAV